MTFTVGPVPVNGGFQAFFKINVGLPTKGFDSIPIDRVTPIMAKPVRDTLNQGERSIQKSEN
jgi:hypothetical protein